MTDTTRGALVTGASAGIGASFARLLATPGLGEDFFRVASEPAPEGSSPIPVDFDLIREAAMQTGAIEILGPPPF